MAAELRSQAAMEQRNLEALLGTLRPANVPDPRFVARTREAMVVEGRRLAARRESVDRDATADPVPELLQRLKECEAQPTGESFLTLYDAMRSLARRAMKRQQRSHTLQATALAHEAFLKLVRQDVDLRDRSHFLAVAVRAMRSILVDHARTRSRRKRHATGTQLRIDQVLAEFEGHAIEILDLDEALERLSQSHEHAARIVELHFFGGLGFREIARVLDVPLRTVEREWSFARAWLHAELT